MFVNVSGHNVFLVTNVRCIMPALTYDLPRVAALFAKFIPYP